MNSKTVGHQGLWPPLDFALLCLFSFKMFFLMGLEVTHLCAVLVLPYAHFKYYRHM